MGFGRPVLVGATPLADHPIKPVRGQVDQVTPALAEVTNLNQDLTVFRAANQFCFWASLSWQWCLSFGSILRNVGGSAEMPRTRWRFRGSGRRRTQFTNFGFDLVLGGEFVESVVYGDQLIVITRSKEQPHYAFDDRPLREEV